MGNSLKLCARDSGRLCKTLGNYLRNGGKLLEALDNSVGLWETSCESGRLSQNLGDSGEGDGRDEADAQARHEGGQEDDLRQGDGRGSEALEEGGEGVRREGPQGRDLRLRPRFGLGLGFGPARFEILWCKNCLGSKCTLGIV